LPQALQSVFDQAVNPFEVIVIDDGSTDNTSDIMPAFEPRVRYVRQDHRGVSAARNLGLDVARGDIIAWLDADDLWRPDFLGTVIPLLAADPELDGVYTGFVLIDAVGNILPQSRQKVVPPSELFSSLIDNNHIQTSAIVVRKICFEQVGNFDTRFGICEDHDMWLRLAKAFVIVGVPLPLVKYRVLENSTQSNTTAFARFQLAMIQKHFGALEGAPQTWSEEKRRAYAQAFRSIALRYIQDSRPDRGWHFLEEAVSIWPDLLKCLDTSYELVCGDQPRGYRGQPDLLDIEGNGAEMLKRLDGLFAKVGPRLEPLRRTAYANAYLALGMLSDQAGRWATARRYLVRAILANRRLLGSYSVIRRLLKLCAGRRLAHLGRLVSGSDQQAAPHDAIPISSLEV
jgi:glycosyltransferase involved in cell wall biosynthesis